MISVPIFLILFLYYTYFSYFLTYFSKFWFFLHFHIFYNSHISHSFRHVNFLHWIVCFIQNFQISVFPLIFKVQISYTSYILHNYHLSHISSTFQLPPSTSQQIPYFCLQNCNNCSYITWKNPFWHSRINYQCTIAPPPGLGGYTSVVRVRKVEEALLAPKLIIWDLKWPSTVHRTKVFQILQQE